MTTITQTISPLSTPPSTNDPATFDTRADTFLGELPDLATEINTWAGQANTVAGEIDQNRIDAEDAQTAAEAAQALAEAAADAAESASNATQWVSGQAYLAGDVVWSPINFKSYRANTNTSGTTDPSLSASWTALGVPLPISIANGGTGLTALGTAGQIIAVNSGATALEYINLPAGSEIVRVARTSNTAIASSNRGNLIDITSGTFTQTFDACSALGDGFFCYIRNSGTGDITLDPNSSETIDGLTSYIMYPGEVRLVQCDGSALRSVVIDPFAKTFLTSGTFTRPPGYSVFRTTCVGGGNGGNGSTTGAGGNGGSAGRVLQQDFAFADIGSSVSVTVGAAGAGGTSGGGTGGTGGSSSFGSASSASGVAGAAGGGGQGSSTPSLPGAGGVNGPGGGGGGAYNSTGLAGGIGGAGAAGFVLGGTGGTGGGGAGGIGGTGNSGLFGSGGGGGGGSAVSPFTTAAGGIGGVPGGGGGGASGGGGITPSAGGAGGAGAVYVWGIV